VRTYLTTLTRSNSVLFKVLRFALVGVLSSGIFSVVTVLMAGLGGLDPTFSSVIAYLVAVPLNFIGNRTFSFLSRNGVVGDLSRFAAMHVANILLVTVAMETAVNVLHFNYTVGILAGVVLVPAVSFVAMNWWVFRSSVGRRAAIPTMLAIIMRVPGIMKKE
jgi:putative flippase GtrA